MTDYQPRPGDLGFSKIEGFVGEFINFGQSFLGDGSRFHHVFVVLDDETVMEAQPKGAAIAPLSKYKDRAMFSNVPLTEAQREVIVETARGLEGTKYGFSGYLLFALGRFGLKPKWLVNYVVNNGRMICSQLGDYVYWMAQHHFFDDGRGHHAVNPGDIFWKCVYNGWLRPVSPGFDQDVA